MIKLVLEKAERSDQIRSVAQLCPTICDPLNCSTPGLPVHHQLPEFTQTHVHRVMMPSSHLILCRPLVLLPPISQHQGLFHESILHMRWPKYWSFSFNIIPSNEHPGLVSFRDSQESPPTPQFKSINSSALSILYGPTLSSVHDYWKNHNFNWTDLCQQANVSAF